MQETALDIASIKEQVFGVKPAEPAATSTTSSEEPTITPITKDVPQGSTENVPRGTNEEPPATFDPNSYIKEHLGYENLEAAKSAKEAYEALKNAPTPTAAQYKWDNPESERIANMIKSDKKALKAWLDTQELVEDFETKNDEQKLKTYLKVQNPLYDQELIDARYSREYAFNEESFKDENGNIADPLAYRLAKIDVQQKMKADLAKAAEYISQQKTKIVLPDSSPATPPVDQAYQEYKASLKAEEENQKLIEASLAKISDKDAVYTHKFNDEASKLNAEISYVPDAKAFEAAKAGVADIFGFLNKNYRSEDGSPLTTKLVKDLAILQNLEGFTTEVIIQATNAERRRTLAQAKNIGDNVQKNYATVVPDAIQKLREQVFGKTA